MNSAIVVLLLSVILNAIAQLSLKHGIMQLQTQTIEPNNSTKLDAVVRLAKNRFVMVWIACLIPSVLLWLTALSMVELSFAYPFLSLSFVLIVLGSIFFLNEKVTNNQWLAMVLIVLGVVLIADA